MNLNGTQIELDATTSSPWRYAPFLLFYLHFQRLSTLVMWISNNQKALMIKRTTAFNDLIKYIYTTLYSQFTLLRSAVVR